LPDHVDRLDPAGVEATRGRAEDTVSGLHPGSAPAPPEPAPGEGRAIRVNHEYKRGGAISYLAAYDVHRVRVFGRCADSTGIVPFMALVEQVMTVEPYASARRVFWIVDNGSSHAGKTSIRRMQEAHQNARLIHLPIHASWLNQIEIYFSVVQRKVLTPNDFAGLQAVVDRLDTFERHYNQIAKPFEWNVTRHSPRSSHASHSHEPRLQLVA
jgi:hypothetical protein